MSISIVNRTPGALKVPLRHGKVLRLGPNQTGHISHHDVDHPPLKKLIDAGTAELTGVAESDGVPTQGRRGEMPFEP